jgi:hypothetical protein
MKNHFILSSSNHTRRFICLSEQSSITILSATLLSNINNWQLWVGNAYIEICFLYSDEAYPSRESGLARPLNLLVDAVQKQPIIQYNLVCSNSHVANSNHFYNKLSIKLVERKHTKPVEWKIEYESNLLKEIKQ